METIRVPDKAVVLVLNKREAEALQKRLKQHTGIKKSQALMSVECKLNSELEWYSEVK